MSACERLPNRSGSVTFAFDRGPHRYVATISFFPGAVVASIALPVDTIRKALLRDGQGKASSPLGCALDAIAGWGQP